jgi:transposase
VEEVVLRLEKLLFPAIADVAVLSVNVDIEIVRVDAQCTTAGATCPGCGSWSTQIHSSYLRFPADVPSAGRSVVLQLRVRRFRCGNAMCPRRTLVEQIPGLTRRHGQRTERLRSTLAAVGLALAGRAGARLASVLGLSVSRSTVLRLVDALPDPEAAAPRVVGVDEYATRKGRHYGTVLVDVETRRPIDLLPDRAASILAAWLAQRPSVEVVCRDRAPFFAEGAAAGAPQAIQVADRWHLWHNLSDAAERSVAQHRHCLRVLIPATPESESEPAPAADQSGSPWPRGHRFADRTRARHAAVHILLEAGHSRRSIQRQLGTTYRTVKQLNQMWRFGDELAVRMQRMDPTPELQLKERRWLPVLAPRLPLPVPAPVRFGEPSERFPKHWTVMTWVPGEPLDHGSISRGDHAADTLAGFLRALPVEAPAEAPISSDFGAHPKKCIDGFENFFQVVVPDDIAADTRAVWDDAIAAPEWES